MANSIFSALGGQQINSTDDFGRMMNDLQNFKRNFKGNAKEQVQAMLANGTMSQADYNRFGQMATQFIQMMNGRR